MPCHDPRNDPNSEYSRSLLAVQLIVWLADNHLKEEIPVLIRAAADERVSIELDAATSILCAMCKRTPEEVIYNGRDRMARKLADWWDDHKAMDAEREAKE